MSVAIRTATRIADQDDLGSVPGAGNDGYALTWDNGAGAFVLTEMAASGLAADGSVTGATAQAQAFTNGIIGPSWKPSANSTTALQLQNAAGANVLNVDTTNGRIGIGTTGPFLQIDAQSSSSLAGALFAGLGNGFVYSTVNFGRINAGVYQRGWSYEYRETSNQFDSVFRQNNRGAGSGTWYDRLLLVDGTPASPVTITATSGMLIPGSVGIGTASTSSLLHAVLASAATNAVTNILTIDHSTSGTAAAGFGAGQLFRIESSTGEMAGGARIQALWYEATHATRKSDLVGTAYDAGGEREGWRVRGNGSAAAFSVLGADPIARIAHVADPAGGATVDAEARSAINSILATLEGFGFHATS